MSAKAQPDDQAIQVILDALPSGANSLALGASLQNVLLSGISGLTLDSLQVNPVAGVESLGDNGSVSDNIATQPSSQNQITFQFSVNGDDTALQQVLVNLEKSIRTIDVTSLNIESQGETQMMTVQARAYYEPAVNLNLTNEVIK